jgi:hypothetical protein
MPNYRKPEDARPSLDKLKRYQLEAGRENSGFGVEARIPYGEGNPEIWNELIKGWQIAGATHFSFNTMDSGFQSAGAHMSALQRIATSLGIHR